LPGVSDLFFAQATGNLDFVINLADSFANFGIPFLSLACTRSPSSCGVAGLGATRPRRPYEGDHGGQAGVRLLSPEQVVQQTNDLQSQFQNAAKVTYAGLAPGYVGLYQFNVVAPSVAASDNVPVTFTLGGEKGDAESGDRDSELRGGLVI
jgi:hypothetical protein